MASRLALEDALLLNADLVLARQRLDTKSDLHAMYLLTDVREKIDLKRDGWDVVYHAVQICSQTTPQNAQNARLHHKCGI